MINFENVTVNSKTIFDKYYSIAKVESSAISFTNLFTWQHAYPVKYTIIKDYLCILGKDENTYFWYMPIGAGNITDVINKMMEYCNNISVPFRIWGLDEHILNLIQQVFPEKFIIKENRDYFDYVYLSSNLINLSGKKFHSKRNHVNKFKRDYDYIYSPITEDTIDECIDAAIRWCEKRNCSENIELKEEKCAIIKAFKNFSELGLKGGIIKVNKKVAAFTYGEQITKDMIVVHVEKGDLDIKGVYNIINQQFCENECSNIKFINREEDLGIAGLRKSKLSYHPIKFIKNYTAILK